MLFEKTESKTSWAKCLRVDYEAGTRIVKGSDGKTDVLMLGSLSPNTLSAYCTGLMQDLKKAGYITDVTVAATTFAAHCVKKYEDSLPKPKPEVDSDGEPV